ncbi:MAG: phosphatidate cytidylyltransferase [Bacteroidia bacterium]|nr:phosphatidate cytidylyltransferase [Bacteroidia bacterium]
MPTEVLNTIYLACAFLGLFALAEVIYYVFKPKAEYTRKLVHFGTGIITLLFPIYLTSHWSVLFLCGCFALILLVSLKFNLLKSINAIDRKSHGSISYPVSVYGCFLFYMFMANGNSHFTGKYFFFYLPILTLAICDPIAALIGKRWPYKKFKVGDGQKSVMGSFSFFISALVLSVFSLCHFPAVDEMSFFLIDFTGCLVIAILATLAEAFSRKGFDNLSIPAAVIVGILFYKHFILGLPFTNGDFY